MLNISSRFQSVISAFSSVFTKPTWKNATKLLYGAILCPGSRTVANVLRTLGLDQQNDYYKYHRVLSRAKWQPLKLSRLLLEQLIRTFCSAMERLEFGVDETIERRWGPKIIQRGIYRDAVRSSKSHVVKCSGLRWMSMMLLSPLPWLDGAMRWALPFLTALCPSRRYYEDHTRRGRPKKLTDWARQMILWLSRYVKPYKSNVCLVGDGSYATYELMQTASQQGVTLISRLKMNARLYHLPKPKPASQRGPQPLKGARLLGMKKRVDDGRIKWESTTVDRWYDQQDKELLFTTGVAVWNGTKKNQRAIIRWVLVKDPAGEYEPALIGISNTEESATDAIQSAANRWGVEVTFEEGRRHLGMETQRQWSRLAIERTTPILLALKSIVCLLGKPLFERGELVNNAAAWYQKSQTTFSDILASVQTRMWSEDNYLTTGGDGVVKQLRAQLKFMRKVLVLAAA